MIHAYILYNLHCGDLDRKGRKSFEVVITMSIILTSSHSPRGSRRLKYTESTKMAARRKPAGKGSKAKGKSFFDTFSWKNNKTESNTASPVVIRDENPVSS